MPTSLPTSKVRSTERGSATLFLIFAVALFAACFACEILSPTPIDVQAATLWMARL